MRRERPQFLPRHAAARVEDDPKAHGDAFGAEVSHFDSLLIVVNEEVTLLEAWDKPTRVVGDCGRDVHEFDGCPEADTLSLWPACTRPRPQQSPGLPLPRLAEYGARASSCLQGSEVNPDLVNGWAEQKRCRCRSPDLRSKSPTPDDPARQRALERTTICPLQGLGDVSKCLHVIVHRLCILLALIRQLPAFCLDATTVAAGGFPSTGESTARGPFCGPALAASVRR